MSRSAGIVTPDSVTPPARVRPAPPGFQVKPWLPPSRVCSCREHILRPDGSWHHATWTDTRPMPGRWPTCDRTFARLVERAVQEWEERDVAATRALYFKAIEEERD